MKYLSQQNPTIFQGKRVLVRVDYNVPIIDGAISSTEAFRIHATLPTIEWLQKAGAKIILISHIGRSGDSLCVVYDYLQEYIPELNIQFVSEVVGEQATESVNRMESGQILLLENVRKEKGEELNDSSFVQSLSLLGDYFVNDAFAVSHRAHASVVGIATHLPSFAGLLMEQEIIHLEQALEPSSPSVLIMAGIKFETKLPLIEKLLPLYDSVILGGGLLNTYLKSFGIGVGKSVIDDSANLSSIIGSKKIIIPEYVIVERNGEAKTITVSEIMENDIIVDVVIDTQMKQLLQNAKIVVWNGPIGWYEKGYTKSIVDIVENLGNATMSIAGGGDTVTAIQKLGLTDQVSFLSTGGGAMLEYLQNGTIVGLENL